LVAVVPLKFGPEIYVVVLIKYHPSGNREPVADPAFTPVK
jgi:hypothetical protein